MENSLNGGTNSLKPRRDTFGLRSFIIAIIIGLVFIGAGLTLSIKTKIDSSWIQVTGRVTSSVVATHAGGGTRYDPVVTYVASGSVAHGQTFQFTEDAPSKSKWTIGTTRQLAYDPSFPDRAKSVSINNTYRIVGYVGVIIGILTLIIAPLSFIKSSRRSKDIQNLTQSGQKIQGVVTSVQDDSTGTVGNDPDNLITYRVTVSATSPSGAQNYTSDWAAGLGALAMFDYRTHPISIDVYINPTNPEDYYVDLASLPNLKAEFR
jgi:hypothetical protein